jgi:hypothetical protein
MTVVSTLDLTNAVFARLDAHDTLTVYRSVAAPEPPADEGGVTQGYAVLHPFPGNATSGSLSRAPGQLLWEFQVSCAGGDHDYVLWTVDTVRGLLDGKTLTVAGARVGLMQPPVGFQPPAPRPAPVDSGQRLQIPLLYQVLAVPA